MWFQDCGEVGTTVGFSSTLHIIIACEVLYNVVRKAAFPVPDDYCEGNIAVPILVLPNADQGEQALRAVLLRHFQ